MDAECMQGSCFADFFRYQVILSCSEGLECKEIDVAFAVLWQIHSNI
jgi:hypothetical protein